MKVARKWKQRSGTVAFYISDELLDQIDHVVGSIRDATGERAGRRYSRSIFMCNAVKRYLNYLGSRKDHMPTAKELAHPDA